MPRQQHRAEDFLRSEQMMNVRARIVAARGAVALRINRRIVLLVTRVAHIQNAVARESLRRSARTRRHDAVEHINAAQNRPDDVVRTPDAH